jgi:glutamyl-tRNA reductase
MKQLENKTYILIGAGNMANYLLANANAALTCMGIYSRSPEKTVLQVKRMALRIFLR